MMRYIWRWNTKEYGQVYLVTGSFLDDCQYVQRTHSTLYNATERVEYANQHLQFTFSHKKPILETFIIVAILGRMFISDNSSTSVGLSCIWWTPFGEAFN